MREKWKLGIDPIPNMTELFEEKGLKVLMVATSGTRLRVYLYGCSPRRSPCFAL